MTQLRHARCSPTTRRQFLAAGTVALAAGRGLSGAAAEADGPSAPRARSVANAEAKPQSTPAQSTPAESTAAGATDDAPFRGKIYKAVKTRGNISRRKIEQLKALGFDGIESGSPGVKDIPALVAECNEVGLPIHGVVDMVHWKQRISSPDGAAREAGRNALAQACRDAHALGGSSVLLVPGRVGGADETHDDVWNRSIGEIRQVLPIASKLGVRILIETVWNGFCESPAQMRDYIDAIDSPWVDCYFDIGNMQKFAPAEEWIRTLGRRVVKLDVKDWGKKNGFCPLGAGDVDWAAVRAALAEIGFSGWATREGNDGGVEKTARLMNEVLGI